ncbi:glycoside hydrolase family 88/105 protein [Pinibacter aurantiacus]|uniref:Glycoside hydrolase family 88 protein n=1 Tax=Pinibacter aurantiacus TaxID=2851599 RepID=A0A9E2SCL0_9BACT|nr:glycoside hydrolase family 88 protein [Pinibacter aurantiacus]MBV4358852.1 glycoside hydrolase family 88 protein [Pinibacter aurantiacus]
MNRKKKIGLTVLSCLFISSALKAQAPDLFQKAFIKKEMVKAADWQLSHSNGAAENSWTNGVFYVGVDAAYQTTGEKRLFDSLMAIGERKQWMPGRQFDNADDIVICQTYIDLYRIVKDKKMIQPTIDTVHKMETAPNNALVRNRGLLWWWCDALFMAPPTLAKLSKTFNDPHYLVLADTLYRQTYRLLYDHEEKLFARDAAYLANARGGGKKEANGKKVFWGRGNGWVMAGLVNLLKEMPQDYAGRSFYVGLFKEMAGRVLELQQSDGLWRSSLLDPESFPGGEGSGSGLYCYALAWGINQHILDKKSYLQPVKKAWTGLTSLVNEAGRVGWVQPIGEDPKKNFNADSWQSYGTGAFLLAGSEIVKLKK